MLSLVFLILSFLFNVNYVQAKDPECKDLHTCLNCTFAIAGCEWTGMGNCEKSSSSDKVSFYTKFDTCSDTETQLTKQKYCGSSTLESTTEDNQGSSLLEVDGKYGIPYLVCKYTYENDNKKKNVLVNVKRRRGTEKKAIMYLAAVFFDDSFADRLIDKYDYLVSVEKGRDIHVYYFTTESFFQSPFMIYVKAEKPGVSITLIITIILVIAACIICSVSIFIFSKRLARRNAFAQRNMMIGVVVNQQGQPIGIQESEEDIKKRKLNQLEELLKENMMQREFNDSLGKYNLNCTICLEEYTSKSTVCLTPCNHVFHYDCITVWLTKNLLNSKCPNCNFHLLPEVNDNANPDLPVNPPIQNVYISTARQNNNQPNLNVPYNSVNVDNLPQNAQIICVNGDALPQSTQIMPIAPMSQIAQNDNGEVNNNQGQN